MIPIIDQAAIDRAGGEPLGILASCAMVVNGMASVELDHAAVERLAGEIVTGEASSPLWDGDIHFQGTGANAIEETIGWIFALDALNFCFWGQDPNPAFRWRIISDGVEYDGYVALAIALRDAARSGTRIWDPAWLATVDEEMITHIFAPAPGSAPIPLFNERVRNLRQLGEGIERLDLGKHPFTAFVEGAGGSAPRLVQAVVAAFPSFNDVAAWTPPGAPGSPVEVRFYKRAQILVSDLSGALAAIWADTRSAALHEFPLAAHPRSPLVDREHLTAFADYKVPQVLRHVGILRYRDDLARAIRRRAPIAPGSREEIEIRAATVWACELLRQGLADRGSSFTAAEVDWLLWNEGQDMPATCEPYHRTVTMFY